MTDISRLTRLFSLIDEKNNEDPNRITVDQESIPAAYLYGVRMTEVQHAFAPDADELLQIACRAQHIQRWQIPRSDFPMDKAGYKRWRTRLAQFHAELTSQLMQTCDYTEEEQQRVSDLLQKKGIKRDTGTQTLEDVACLVFLSHYFEEFAARHDDEKVIDIVKKTWPKMSEEGHAVALQLTLPPNLAELVGRALS